MLNNKSDMLRKKCTTVCVKNATKNVNITSWILMFYINYSHYNGNKDNKINNYPVYKWGVIISPPIKYNDVLLNFIIYWNSSQRENIV